MLDWEKEKRNYEGHHFLSRHLYKQARGVMPGGISHNIRLFPPFPFFVKEAKGPYLIDVDGRRYLDFWMGHHAHILGHGFPPIAEGVAGFVRERGYHFGLINKEELGLAERVVALVPCAETVRFCNSGTEAGMYALRLARAYTGRSKVIKIMGGWHGASTDLSCYITPPFKGPESDGLPPFLADDVLGVPFNDLDAAIALMDEAGDELAALILEPVLGVGGFIPPAKRYLEGLKEELERRGALLIFDEVITGFRLSLGGAQGYFGVTPHLVVLGKVLGGGFPIGAVAGPREIMELADPSRGRPRVLIGGGTFSCNPISMVAGTQMLDYLSENASWVYPLLADRGEKVRGITKNIFNVHRIRAEVTGISSLFMVHFLTEEASAKNPIKLLLSKDLEMEEAYGLAMINRGVFLMHGGGSISLVHTDDVLEDYFQALYVVVQEMKG